MQQQPSRRQATAAINTAAAVVFPRFTFARQQSPVHLRWSCCVLQCRRTVVT